MGGGGEGGRGEWWAVESGSLEGDEEVEKLGFLYRDDEYTLATQSRI